MVMHKLLQCRKATVILYIIMLGIIIVGAVMGIIGHSIGNELMLQSMLLMPILVFCLGFVVCKVEHIDLRVRSQYMRNTIKRGDIRRASWITFGILALSILLPAILTFIL